MSILDRLFGRKIGPSGSTVDSAQKSRSKPQQNPNPQEVREPRSVSTLDAIAYHNKSVDLRQLQRYKEALVACEQAIRLGFNGPVVYNHKAAILNDLQRYEEALAAFEQAVHLDSGYAFAYEHGVRLNPNYAPKGS